MSSSNRISISIRPLNYADIPACAQITSSAFSVDPHTIVKQLGRKHYDMYAISRSNFIATLHRKTHIYVKGVDEETGEVVGHAGWAFRGVDAGLIPWRGPEDEKLVEEETEKNNERENGDQKESGEENEEDSIDRLHALEDADMQAWLSDLVPKDIPCMFVVGLTVSLSHQSRGVGSALIQYGNAIADTLGAFIWVHSSHQAWNAYKKFGFKVVKELEIDLDEYAPRGPREREEVMGDRGKWMWGRYVIRYMKRTPEKQGYLG